jgi:N4-gp56 family major capsid protein
MAIQNTTNLSNAVTARYTQKYQEGARPRRIYDQLALPVGAPQFDLEQRKGLGSSYIFNFLSRMTPNSNTVSEIADLTPQMVRDATSSITPTSRMDGLQWSELVDLSAYTDYVGKRAQILGDNAMETIENLAIDSALAGSIVYRAEARATLDSVDATSRWTEAQIWLMNAMIQELKCPAFVSPNGNRSWLAIAHTDPYYDLFHGGNVQSAIIYGGLPGNILFNGELGMIGNFKIIASPFAKVFGGAGEDADSGSSQTYTLSAAAKALDKTMSVNTGTNLQYGRYITVGTEETGNTFYPTNERVRWISGTTTATIVGSGENGGLMYDHAAGEYALNADSVYPVVYGTPGSLVKVYANETGEFGQTVGPKDVGIVNQWQTMGWKFYGGYGRMAENRIARGEYSCSLDDVQ